MGRIYKSVVLTKTELDNRSIYMAGDFKKEFTCISCGNKVGIDDSISHQGFNLICNACKYRMESVLAQSVICRIHEVGREKEAFYEITKEFTDDLFSEGTKGNHDE